MVKTTYSTSLRRLVPDGEVFESLKVSIPLVMVQLVESIYSITDTYFVSGLGKEAIAGIGVAGYLMWLIGVFVVVFQAPMGILVAQLVGAGRYEEASRVAGCILVVGIVYALVFSLVLYGLAEHLVVMVSGAVNSMYMYAVDYLKIRLLGFTALATSMMLDSSIVASGRTKYSMISHTAGVCVNIVLDPLLIYGLYGFPRLGVVGAAYATVIASTITIPLQLLFLSKLKLFPAVMLSKEVVRKAVSLGLPVLGERALIALGNNAYAGAIARLGETAMAAHSIGLRIESLVYMPGFAFMMSASALVGHRIGRGDIGSARRVGLKIIHTGALFMTLLGLVLVLFGYHLVAPFSPSGEVRELASLYLTLAGLSELGLGLAMISSGAIRGAGETRTPFLVNTLSMVFVRVAPSIALANLLGVLGPWLAMFLDVYVRGFTLYTIFRWRFHKIAKKWI